MNTSRNVILMIQPNNGTPTTKDWGLEPKFRDSKAIAANPMATMMILNASSSVKELEARRKKESRLQVKGRMTAA